MPDEAGDRLERHTRTVTLLTFLSRVTGLVRDAVLSRIFGVGAVMDAFAFAFMLPNLFRRLFGEGALSAAFLPVYARLDRGDQPTAGRLAAMLIATMVVLLGGVAVLGEALLWLLLELDLYRNGDHHAGILTLRLMILTLPYMPFVCLVAILGAILNVRGQFAPTAAAPVLLNLTIAGAALGSSWFIGEEAIGDQSLALRAMIVSAAVSVAGLVQVLWSFAALRGSGIDWLEPLRAAAVRADTKARAALREVLVKAGPMILGLGVLQLNTFIDGLIASWPSTIGPTILGVAYPLESGALATLGYAQRLYEFPLGVFGIAVATAIFPLLAKQSHDRSLFLATLRRGLRLTLFIGLPASVGLMLTAAPLTAVVLQGGDFGPEDTRRVAFVLLGYAPAVWAYSLNHTMTRGCYALGDSAGPVRISLTVLALNFALNIGLIWTPLREAGLAWSTAICAVIQSILLARLLRHRLEGLPLVDHDVRRSWMRTALASAAMAAVVWPVAYFTAPADSRWLGMLVSLALCVAAGAIVYAVVARAMRMPELRWALGRRSVEASSEVEPTVTP